MKSDNLHLKESEINYFEEQERTIDDLRKFIEDNKISFVYKKSKYGGVFVIHVNKELLYKYENGNKYYGHYIKYDSDKKIYNQNIINKIRNGFEWNEGCEEIVKSFSKLLDECYILKSMRNPTPLQYIWNLSDEIF